MKSVVLLLMASCLAPSLTFAFRRECANLGACGGAEVVDPRRIAPLAIWGGSDAVTEEGVSTVPWQVGIARRGFEGAYCGGSLIARQYILTAAHCL